MKYSKLPRIYIDNNNININSKIKLEQKQDFHYLIKVLRLKTTNQIRVFNERVGEYIAEISEVQASQVILKILKHFREPKCDTNNIHLLQALVKKDKMEEIVTKVAELGINSITPLITERVQQNYKLNMERLNKHAMEATRQSENLKPPKINRAENLLAYLEQETPELIIVCDENKDHCWDLKNLVEELKTRRDTLIIIGPEGGFSEVELEKIYNSDAFSLSLGDTVLRSETAATAAISVVKFLQREF